jgi:hypothetical protein
MALRSRSAAIALIVSACVLVPPAVLAGWVHRVVYDRGEYVATMSPLADEPAIQRAVARRASAELSRLIDLDQYLGALPPEVRRFGPLLESALDTLIDDVTLDFLRSEEFREVWRDLNRAAHPQLKLLLSGEGEAPGLRAEGDRVVLDLEPLVRELAGRVEARSIRGLVGDLRDVDAKVVIVQGGYLDTTQAFVRLFDRLAYVLPLVILACFGGAIALSRNRRHALLGAAAALALTAGVLLATIGGARRLYLRFLSDTGVSASAAGEVYDVLVEFLRSTFTVVFLVGVVVALGAWIAGRVPRRERSEAELAVRRYVVVHKTGLRVTTVLVALALFLWLQRPSPLGLLLIATVVVVVLAGITAIVHGDPPDPAEAARPSAGGAA